ncbi:uncharacterized protein LOC119634392 isoform X2 [Glossina fuscipes]|nr:uncharacterized protein LOC119634392 isoform X2 [Glossina fuscipes]XP_037884445.1 uncharacterized protein LOC119634392 isoform X2 [Glossina fuscipes]XP_037884446.1 uncharacterized protein LOC119634392 isoform X2 [Glossina fuscipes]XP_037884447.1 uncharacterized protein LOC119634392 isoform X2 [Glossina fuscipes]XP_037884448.1 uncharacterized protein LOC119634392 isoform X2 [Glossina fuscipes]XP_037884449.1 uncharacterized protein LOC119634392 isoform X2 [Glossina fuscipes]
MNLHKLVGIIGLLGLAMSCQAYPTLALPRFHRSVDRIAKGLAMDLGFPKTDDDVLQLERLRELREKKESQPYYHQKKNELIADEIPSVVDESPNTLPELEQQLESAAGETTATPSKAPAETPSEAQTNVGGTGIHRPPHLQNNDGGKAETVAGGGGEKAKAAAKCRLGMHGAARLMYGQNPEVLPTTTSTSAAPAITTTSTTSTSTSTIAAVDAEAAPVEEDKNIEASGVNEDENDKPVESEATEMPAVSSNEPVHLNPMRPMKAERKPNKEDEPARQLIGDVIIDETAPLRKSASRRSVPTMSSKTAESLLKHANGQYSSFDMAQYVFWTGDEAGVARAVEELIHRDAMSREEALKFLHDIRMGIEYLQKSYANRIFPEEIHHNTVKKSFMPTTTTTTTTTTTALPYVKLEQNLQETDSENLNLAKTLDSISLWHKLQALNNEDGQDLADLDASETRHSKITDCEHKEYNLEEIIYKLARIMFTQSLTHGSDEAQKEIQKLTEFLEREHKLGVIPVDLEKKVIHVLLQALSDTLTDKPELWPAAQYPYNRLLRSYAHANYGGSSLNSV